jgi:hypothetical protein
MAERARIAGLAAVAVACLGLATGLGWWAAALFHEVDEFYRSSAGDDPPDVARYYDQLSHSSNAMQSVMSPLLAGAVLAVLALLIVLALRWEHDAPRATPGRRGWVAGLPVVVVMCAVGALILTGGASSLLLEADTYFSGIDFATAGPVEIDQAEFDVYNYLAVLANTLMGVVGPLITCALAGLMAWLAVLAWRRSERSSA